METVEIIKRVSLVKETPSDYLLNLFERKLTCIYAIADLYEFYLYSDDNYHRALIRRDDISMCIYWIMYNFDFTTDVDSDDYQDITGCGYVVAEGRQW
jgi:hypothetical protein